MQSKTELKARAKRLRAAIKTVLSIEATNSQALELVAQEENFPTWDAASACYGNRTGPGRTFLNAERIELNSPYILISGLTATGKSTLAKNIANRLVDSSASLFAAKPQGPLSVVVVSHCQEWPAESFISAASSDFAERLGRLDLRQTVLVIDDCLGIDVRDTFWLDIALLAYAAVVTCHSGVLAKLDAEAISVFQQVDCN